jgi:hypothetical protein
LLFGFVEGIDGKGDHVCMFLFELIDMSLEVGYLPNAVRSPDTAVEDDNGVFTS